MKSLLITLDYELFGDGSGSVFKHIVDPTNTIIEVAERYGAKITVFFEVVEYWRLKQEWESGNHMGYKHNPVEAMEQQLIGLIKRGHDVQLHLHPQWVNARWKDDKWIVDLDNWRLSDFNSPTITLKQLIADGKRAIEEIIRVENPDYECNVLRAGGYNAQPSKEIVELMREFDMKADSSVVPGAVEQGSLSQYDYRISPLDMGVWNVNDVLERPSDEPSEIKEFPVVAFPVIRLLKFMSITRIKSIFANRKSAQASFSAKTTDSYGNGDFINKISFFFKKEYQTWDYCLFTKWMHRYFLSKISRQKERDTFVVIGHPKSLVSTKSLDYLFRKTIGRMNYRTISEML
ncbi:MAG: hypothetical protein IKX31_11520 [Muribaculaceae bacterium]|nr:hypothetical protein [Muribaculaceae bacterium]